ncbi:SDR family oxidoreductase [Paraburkholderia saeva]|uniref:Oxidoreductase n=1 Tax=Paraburkholderia saeva TaxID=2777537 RepID=A0A9N8X2D3_9BURK|nr:SDR family oxidoreductase [Paraburkholderia saeva]CAG4891679.1 putative oxidoreductase [Paraburkholderia saeva]CAG4895604.1 putative oxidoreductase [Paraburkholderia saeva]CAG4903562.1 putative oxidoreductase [Paraburkholderia saeva]
MKNILIVGGSSAIAVACARRWAKEGANLFLTGRHEVRLAAVAQDLRVRGAPSVETHMLDMNDHLQHATMLKACQAAFGRIDIVLIAHGTLSNQAQCERDVEAAMRELSTNAMSTIALLTLLAGVFESQKSGTIAVISSVAGDRGRPSNYVYGAAKAAVGTFCEGLRARLFKSGVRVLTIKPGFVDTPMTAGLSLPGPLVASPERVATDIVRAVERGRDALYTPWFWSGIMLIIRSLPEFVFKRVSL